MDSGIYNRYELLFLEDDSSDAPTTVVGVAKNSSKKSQKNKKTTMNKVNQTKNVNKKNVVPTQSSSNENRRNDSEAAISSTKKEPLKQPIPNITNTVVKDNGDSKKLTPCSRNADNRNFRNNRYRRNKPNSNEPAGLPAPDNNGKPNGYNTGSIRDNVEGIKELNVEKGPENEINNEESEQIEEIKEMTLDEWKALRGHREKPKFNIRKPGEGEDTSKWKKMIVLKKKTKAYNEDEFEYDPSLYPQRVGRLQRLVDIKFQFTDDRRGARYGRGRRNGRIGRSRKFDEGSDNNSTIPKVDDEYQFPTLNKK